MLAACCLGLALEAQPAGPPRASAGGTWLIVRVADEGRAPIEGAELLLLPTPRGDTVRARTGPDGRARLDGLAPARRELVVRHVGHRAGRVPVELAAGRNVVTVLLDPVAVPLLDTVRVLGGRTMLTRHAAFERRLAAGAATAAITAAEIRRRNPPSAWHLLRNVSAVNLIEGPEGVIAHSRRMIGIGPDPARAPPCYLRVGIDGDLLPEVPPNLEQVLPRPAEIHGIELFAGPATLPPEFSAVGTHMFCGLLMVWTK